MRTNGDYFTIHHKLTGFYNRDEKCLQRGTGWVFKLSGLRFVFKGLIYLISNSDLCHLLHKLIGFYNRDVGCLLRGTDWVFII
jgi:hypothetical protein